MTQCTRYRSVVADSARWDGFVFRPDDIVISTPPKCGTTWMQRLVALLVFDDIELTQPISKLSPWLDMLLAKREDVVALLEAQQHRRFIKTHTPFDGLPYDDRVTYICVGRDPRDVAVSALHHLDNLDVSRFMAERQAAVGLEDLAEFGIKGPPAQTPSTQERLREWMDDESPASLVPLAFVLHHLGTFWARRDTPNVVLFHYHDLLCDLPGQMRRLADALHITVADERLTQLSTSATFAAMKQRAADTAPNSDISLWHSTEDFFHRGTSGQWRDVFTADDLRHYDERVAALTTPELAAWLHR
jgi:aryl sulfotransferase